MNQRRIKTAKMQKGKAKDSPRGKNKWKKVEIIERNHQKHNRCDTDRSFWKKDRS